MLDLEAQNPLGDENIRRMSQHRTNPRAGFVNSSKVWGACRWCKGPITEKGRRTFCGGHKTRYSRRYDPGTKRYTREVETPGHGCVHEHCLRSDAGYLRDAVRDRDHGVCAQCGRVAQHPGEWQADHIVPVVEGGGECGLDGMRTLCTACHRGATASLAGRRAQARRDAKKAPQGP